jgi:hypothetical protein
MMLGDVGGWYCGYVGQVSDIVWFKPQPHALGRVDHEAIRDLELFLLQEIAAAESCQKYMSRKDRFVVVLRLLFVGQFELYYRLECCQFSVLICKPSGHLL